MAFIISKKSRLWGKERHLYYLVKNYRDGKKIKRKTLLKLNGHRTVADLLTFTQQEQIRLTARLHKKIEEMQIFIKTGKLSSPFPPTIHTKRNMISNVEWLKADLEQRQKEIERIKHFM